MVPLVRRPIKVPPMLRSICGWQVRVKALHVLTAPQGACHTAGEGAVPVPQRRPATFSSQPAGDRAPDENARGGVHMYFEQVLRPDIGCAAYLIGSNEVSEVAVVDPRIDMVDELIGMAKRERLRICYVIETHNHADHVSGHHVLARRTGATIAIHEARSETRR